jgi:hypothetical protein
MKHLILALTLTVVSFNTFAQSGVSVACLGQVTKNDKLFEVDSVVTYNAEELAKASGYVFIDTDWNSELHLFMGGYIHPAKKGHFVGDAVTMFLDLKTTGISKTSMTKPSFRIAQKYSEVEATEFSLKGSWSAKDNKDSFEVENSIDEDDVVIKYDLACTLSNI